MPGNEASQESFWQGVAVRLRPYTPADAELIYAEQWDTEAIRVLEAGHEAPRSVEQIRALIEKDIQQPPSNAMHFVVETLAGDAAGWVNLRDFQNRAGTFTFAVRIYHAYQHRGYAADAVRIILRMGFYELRCQKCNSIVLEGNEASLRLHLKLGFREEGRLRRNVYSQGRYWDEICLGLTREEFDEMERQTI